MARVAHGTCALGRAPLDAHMHLGIRCHGHVALGVRAPAHGMHTYSWLWGCALLRGALALRGAQAHAPCGVLPRHILGLRIPRRCTRAADCAHAPSYGTRLSRRCALHNTQGRPPQPALLGVLS